MSIIKPFRGLRYDLGRGVDLADVIAPPYDVIRPEMRQRLLERSPLNVIRLILPEAKPGDDQKNNKYTRSADRWRRFREQGALKMDDAPALYRYTVSFSLKSPAGLVEKKRPGFVALLKLHDYAEGKVLPHERTLAGPKQDRFLLMQHTRAHLSQVFLLYPDPEARVEAAMAEEPPAGAEVISAEDDAGVTHTMWPVKDEAIIQAVTAHLEKTPLYIADGHHRYETALAYHRWLVEHSPLFAQGSDYIMAYFTPAEHPGLVIFPYHRLLHDLPKRRLSGLQKKLEQNFNVERALRSPLEPGAPRREFMRELAERGGGRTAFGMVDAAGGHAYYLSQKPSAEPQNHTREIEVILAGLDVVVLEESVLSGVLDIKHKDLVNEKFVTYETDYDQALTMIQKPPFQLLFLVNPTPVQEVIRVADHRGIMPEKSTYFFPKLATGLVMNAMEEG